MQILSLDIEPSKEQRIIFPLFQGFDEPQQISRHIIQVYNYRYFQKRSILFYLVEKNGNSTISFHSPGTWLSFIEDDLTIDQCVEGRNHALFRSNGYFTCTITNPPVLFAMFFEKSAYRYSILLHCCCDIVQ